MMITRHGVPFVARMLARVSFCPVGLLRLAQIPMQTCGGSWLMAPK